jgi:LmbE family N-acetylglucosaminyl deacetylase
MSASLKTKALFQRPLVLVAHQDDEAIGCGILLQRAEQPVVVFATDGAPADQYFWGKYGSPERLAEVRRAEAADAMTEVGVERFEILGIRDQRLFQHLSEAVQRILAIAVEDDCGSFVTHAYEGGHPDHDACSYLACRAGEQLNLPVWEMPLYHRAHGAPERQRFIAGDADIVLEPTDTEYERKQRMAAAYVSQGEVIRAFPQRSELFRRQPRYEYSQPPHPGILNYEAWQWPITGHDVSRAFTEFAPSRS